MSKQVNTVAVEVQAPATTNGNSQTTKNNLFVSVKTFDPEGRTIGERIVDMYHFGTRNWLQNHHWWAMHNQNCVEVNVATDEEISGYLDSAKLALAAKFNGATEAVAA